MLNLWPSYMEKHTNTHTHMYTHVCTSAHIHTHTHTGVHTYDLFYKQLINLNILESIYEPGTVNG